MVHRVSLSLGNNVMENRNDRRRRSQAEFVRNDRREPFMYYQVQSLLLQVLSMLMKTIAQQQVQVYQYALASAWPCRQEMIEATASEVTWKSAKQHRDGGADVVLAVHSRTARYCHLHNRARHAPPPHPSRYASSRHRSSTQTPCSL